MSSCLYSLVHIHVVNKRMSINLPLYEDRFSTDFSAGLCHVGGGGHGRGRTDKPHRVHTGTLYSVQFTGTVYSVQCTGAVHTVQVHNLNLHLL